MRYLAQGWDRLVRYPLLLVVPLVLQVVMSAIGLSAASAVLGWSAAGQIGRGGGWLMLSGIALLLTGPAVASGYNAMVARAAGGEEATLNVMAANLGKYYGRVLGGALLTVMVVGIVAAILGLENSWPISVVSILLAAFTHIWLAAVVIDDVGILAAFGKTWREAMTRIGDYGPLLVVAILASFVVPNLFGGRATDFTETPTFLGNLGSLLSGLIGTAVTMYVRAGVFVAYREGVPSGGSDIAG